MAVEMEVKAGQPATAVITVSGFVETPQARQLRKVFDDAEQQGVGRVIIDISKVPFISSTGLSLLVSYSNLKKNEWGQDAVILVGPAQSVKKAMQILGLTSLFNILPDMQTAASRFGLTE
jgi:anti-anti-sigma factor